MSRLLVFALICSLGHTSVSFAGETLLASATRVAEQLAKAQGPPPDATEATRALTDPSAGRHVAVQASQAQGGAPNRLSTRSKILLGVGAAVAFAAVAYAIDHQVEDYTPSSRGLR